MAERAHFITKDGNAIAERPNENLQQKRKNDGIARLAEARRVLYKAKLNERIGSRKHALTLACQHIDAALREVENARGRHPGISP